MSMRSRKQDTLLHMLREAKQYPVLISGIVTAVAVAANQQVVTYFLGRIVNTALEQGMRNTVTGFLCLMLGIVLLAGMRWVNSWLFGEYANKGLYRIRARTIQAVEGLPLTTVSRYTTGDLISRMNNDLGLIGDFLRNLIQDTGYRVLIGLSAAVYGLFIHYKVTLILLVLSSAVSFINYRLSGPIRKRQEQLQEIAGKVGSVFQDSISGHMEIKTFGLYTRFMNKFGRLAEGYVRKLSEVSRMECFWGAIEITASIGIQIGTVFLCLYFILKKEMTMGDLVIFTQIQQMLRNLLNIQYIQFGKTRAAADRIIELWQEEPERLDGTRREGDAAAPVVAFRNVAYSYPLAGDARDEKARRILDGISFEIARNESVAIVGTSGSGKSTVAKMMCGFIEPDEGTVHFKGFPYAQWDKRSLRQGISLVDQGAHLFPVSIFDNIACGIYGRATAEAADDCQIKEMVEQVAGKVSLSDFIASLDNGYETNAGEYGSKLSGGQRQRLAIARAILKDADLFILDEPTSALDVRTESEIQRSIEEARKGKSTVIIAHRLSTIKNVDRILVMQQGRIVEEGSHESLIRRKGVYYKLYRQQAEGSQEERYGA